MGCWEAGGPLETDVAIARTGCAAAAPLGQLRERGGHDGVLRERGSFIIPFKPRAGTAPETRDLHL